jgi:hypothetical protein
MAKIILLLVLVGFSFVFARIANRLFRYRKEVLNIQGDIGKETFENYHGRYVWVKLALPVLILGLYINAIGAAIAFVYIGLKILH